jgi:lipopolysaccharide/colanic/teichoic acid biosynthesis glycosyltransferase
MKEYLGKDTGHGVIRMIPSVLRGTMSLVGPSSAQQGSSHRNLFIGKPGLTGMIQLQGDRTLLQDEIDQLNLYYARNQSVMLDIEILLKTWLKTRSEKKAS